MREYYIPFIISYRCKHSETLVWLEYEKSRVRAIEMDMLRNACEVRRNNRVRNIEMLERCGNGNKIVSPYIWHSCKKTDIFHTDLCKTITSSAGNISFSSFHLSEKQHNHQVVRMWTRQQRFLNSWHHKERRCELHLWQQQQRLSVLLYFYFKCVGRYTHLLSHTQVSGEDENTTKRDNVLMHTET